MKVLGPRNVVAAGVVMAVATTWAADTQPNLRRGNVYYN